MKNKDIAILIDGGSTHNFVDQSVVTKFGLPVVRDKTLQVMVGYREKIDCSGCCLELTLVIQDHPIQADFYVLLVVACQAVLGVQWLETLGPIETDYRKLTMSFNHDGQPRTFHGLQQPSLTPLTNKELLHMTGGFFLHMVSSTDTKELPPTPPDLTQLLSEFAHVFEAPTQLPPARSHDH